MVSYIACSILSRELTKDSIVLSTALSPKENTLLSTLRTQYKVTGNKVFFPRSSLCI